MAYRRKLIVEKLRDRLKAIQKTNGYATDAGRYLFYAAVNLGPDDPQVGIVFVPGPTTTDVQVDQKIITLPVELHAIGREDLDDPLLTVEDLIGDIKRAIESAEFVKRDLAGLAMKLDAGEVEPLPREEGSTIVGARLTYQVMYAEAWGNPEA